ncbi:PilZ domain-containing protein [Exilibacterium tricleocarpae]|uniref:Cyclic diguanosine monophosphate-binding protein n=1 Tax=Exilibacterium tricleocarpae TaxID=2591008 RepID=A0A545SPS9_9GAMM|nr:PilZ domain-containing protein [Exilibacterium tricleocarpae]TQV66992.1 PilZ domain-containing protein [Exilibacterium tricleocarpae]
MATNDRERRLFSRVNFQARADFHQGARSWEAQVEDVSLQGLMATLPSADRPAATEAVRAVIHLADDTVIQMNLRLAHTRGAQMGFRCENIDLDSIGHLRRLVELNTGNPRNCEQELAMLASG